jgi:hypothetical protein
MSTHRDRINAPQPVHQHDELACQMDGRLSSLILDIGVGPAGPLPLWERMALLFCLAECYVQLPLSGARE